MFFKLPTMKRQFFDNQEERMKKFAAAVLLFGFGASNSFSGEFADVSAPGQVAARPYKFSLGLGMSVVPFSDQGLASFLYNPKKSIGSMGLLVGRYDYVRTVNSVDVGLNGFDAAAAVGVWSNDDKEKTFGWHGYFGIGFSSVQARGLNWDVQNSVVGSKVVALGVDYFWRFGNKPADGESAVKNMALFLEWVAVQRSVALASSGVNTTLDKDLFHMDWAKASRLQLGLRTWF